MFRGSQKPFCVDFQIGMRTLVRTVKLYDLMVLAVIRVGPYKQHISGYFLYVHQGLFNLLIDEGTFEDVALNTLNNIKFTNTASELSECYMQEISCSFYTPSHQTNRVLSMSH